jgi:subtilisin family serine protease
MGAILLTLTAAAQPQPPRMPSRHVEGELLVKFKGGPHGAMAEQARGQMRHDVKRHFDFIGWQQIRLPRGMTVEEGLVRYRNLPGVEAVEPNGLGRLREPAVTPAFQAAGAGITTIPNDPMFPEQWALAKIGATNAWAVTTGDSNVIVAILHTGVNYNHEDLAPNMWRNLGEVPANGIDDDANGFVDDVYGINAAESSSNRGDPIDEGYYFPGFGLYYQGTMNAGLIGAVGNNNLGMAGVNWSVRLMALRFNNGQSIVLADALIALEYVHLMKTRGENIRVLLLNCFFSNDSAAFRDAHARIAALGIIQVTGGPGFRDYDARSVYPGAYELPKMIAVAASDQSDNLTSWTGYGRTNVDLAAPGADIVSSWGPSEVSYYFTYSGVDASMAYVAGAAALLFAAAPHATAEDVKGALLESVDVLPSMTGRVASNGRLNVGKATYHPRIVSKALRFASIRRLDGGGTRLLIEAPLPVEVALETSSDLVTWMPLTTLTFDRQTEFTDSGSVIGDQRFYRARLVSP